MVSRVIPPLSDDELTRIVAAATRLIHEQGSRRLELRSVAELAVVDLATVQAALHDVDGLLTIVLENRDVSDIRAVRALRGNRPLEPFKALHDLVAHNAAQPEIVRLYTILAGEALDPGHPAHDYFRRRYEESIEIMTDIVADHVPDPQATAVQIIALMDGLQLQWLRDLENYDLVGEWDKAAARILAP